MWVLGIFLLILCWYGYQIKKIAQGWSKAHQNPTAKNLSAVSLSIIIPFRASTAHLNSLVAAIQEQRSTHQLILVYDGDRLLEEDWEYVKNRGEGKKAAITTGVEEAEHDWILVLDDDVVFSADFLNAWQNVLAATDAYLLSGLVHSKAMKSSWVQKFQEIEYTTLQVVSVGKIATQHPKLLSAANMAFKKSVFNDVGGYEGNAHIASGDDVFLMMKVLDAYGEDKIEANVLSSSIATTSVKETLSLALRQKKRWTGKIERYPNASIQRWSKAIGVVNLCTAVAMIMTCVNPVFGLGVLAKIILDIYLFQIGNAIFKGKIGSWSLITTGLVYPWYIVVLVLSSLGNKKKELKAPSQLKW